MTYQAIKYFEINKKGRDFVVGDIHGSFQLVIDAIHKINFDPEKDRLFSVGDLVDRGTESKRCSKFLEKHYINAIRGNHEDMLLELYEESEPEEIVLEVICRHNGMNWWLSINKEKRQEIIESFKKLPLVIEIETLRGKVGLIHADVPEKMNWQTFTNKIKEGDKNTIQTCLWGRNRIYNGNHNGVEGVDRVFVGHTPQWNGVNRYGNVYAVDTGAVFGAIEQTKEGHLTMANIMMNTKCLAGPRNTPEILIELKDEALNIENIKPFGKYSKPY